MCPFAHPIANDFLHHDTLFPRPTSTSTTHDDDADTHLVTPAWFTQLLQPTTTSTIGNHTQNSETSTSPRRKRPRLTNRRISIEPNTSPPTTVPTTPPRYKRPRLTNGRISNEPRTPASTRVPNTDCPFLLDFNGSWWNAQALFASDTSLQDRKQRHAWTLLDKSDFAGYAETHSTLGHTCACRLPSTARFFWSHAPSRSQAGVALAVNHSFLQHFNAVKDSDWQELMPGRAAKLSLRGSNGALDLYVCYLHTGTEAATEECKRQLIQRISDSIAPRDTTLTILMGDWNFVMRDGDRFCRRTLQSTGHTDRSIAKHFQKALEPHHFHELEQPMFTHGNTTAHSRIDRIYLNQHTAEQLDRNLNATALAHTELSTHRPVSFSRRSKSAHADDQGRRAFPTYILRHPQWKRNLHLNFQERLHDNPHSRNALHRLELIKEAMWSVATTLCKETPPEATTTEDKLSWTMIFIRSAEALNIGRMERAASAYPHLATFLSIGDPNTRIHANFSSIKDHAMELAQHQLTEELSHLTSSNDEPNSAPVIRRKQQLLAKLARLVPGATNSIGAIKRNDGSLATTPTEIADALKNHWEPIFQNKGIDTEILDEWIATTPNFHGTNDQSRNADNDDTTSTSTTQSIHTVDDNSADDTLHDQQGHPHDHRTLSSHESDPNRRGHVCPECLHEETWCTCRRRPNKRRRRNVTEQTLDTPSHDERPNPPTTRRRSSSPRLHHSRPKLPTEESTWKVSFKDLRKAVKLSGKSAPGPDGIPYAAWKLSDDLALQVLHDAAEALQSDAAAQLLETMHGDSHFPQGHTFNLGLLICLGKKPCAHDTNHGDIFEASSTRPLSIVNTDNRLIANAARLRWEKILNPWVCPQQQGFLRQRSILKNVLDIEYAAMTTSLSTDQGGIIFFDFASAFPSISQEYIFNILTTIGVPKNALNLIHALYHNNRCAVQSNGHRGEGFTLTAGVRQGCPLSPLLYAVCADLLIERIRSKLPSAVIRAYADDTAVLVQNLWNDAPILEKIFQEFAQISNLNLNLSKTIIVPLFPTPSLEEAKSKLLQTTPAWAAVQLSYKAKYLGFLLGPGAEDTSWQEATTKYEHRAQTWANQHLGFHFTATAYNVFALSVLTYLAQLLSPPDELLQTEGRTLRRVAPGPKGWISSSDLWWLQHLTGHPRSLASIKLTSQAAQTRVMVWDPACADHEAEPNTPLELSTVPPTTQSGPVQRQHRSTRQSSRRPNNLSYSSIFQQRARHLRSIISAPEQFYTRAIWKGWFDRSMLLALESNFENVQSLIGPIQITTQRDSSEQDNRSHAHWKKLRRTFQRSIYKALHTRLAPDVHNRFAHKLCRWRLHERQHPLHDHLSILQRTPHWQARCASQRLQISAKLVAPRVHAALFSAIWNRWCTLRRFQTTGTCRLCRRPLTEDAIEHYPFCTVVRAIATRRLRLDITAHVNLHTFTCTNPLINTKELLTRAALLIYSTYRALNYQRQANTPLAEDELLNAMSQWIIEGTRGHPSSCQVLASTWTNREGNRLPALW